MNPEIKELWIEALRSGNYRQGTKALAYDGSYCCLGVLCELAANVGVVSAQNRQTDEGEEYIAYGKSTSFLPDEVMAWSGMPTSDGELDRPVEVGSDQWAEPATTLAVANDRGLTFAQIADVIEEQF